MSKKQNTEAVEAEAPVEATAAITTEQPTETRPKFTIDRLRKDCYNIFGVTTSTFGGATSGLSGEFTVEEMRQQLDEWQNTRITAKKNKEAK